jgi:hypothetical protein
MIEVTEEKLAQGHSVHCISVTCSATAQARTLSPFSDADIPNDAADLLTNCCYVEFHNTPVHVFGYRL